MPIPIELTYQDLVIIRALLLKAPEQLPDNMPAHNRAAAKSNFDNTRDKIERMMAGQ